MTGDPTGNLLTLRVGHLVGQAVVWPYGKIGGDVLIHIPDDVSPVVIQTWPRSSIVRVWPPGAALDAKGLDIFSQNFITDPEPAPPSHGRPPSMG
jgi:hypothetical protein